ncbi:Peptide methionine sulfoxide reductase MsrA [Candidatus Lokiarchaeum ossiferum]|uniref:Peptide methionine sulfoxide reductase MsrA n=1 Tax=Candidatus Lokiarchaeum ossiferum TaxID=2951803 RepID=A0ABY6HKX0_9ARCH|nr:Peptide methionine sulfoxide reductase MsrA [Candidatus Lokiarchaeum sp. B-35]
MEIAIFGAGCFWGVEASFHRLQGVIDTRVGYCGGKLENPSYKEVCRGNTGHAEVVKVIFDPELISYHTLLEHFWEIHDPTTRNRQGPDVGSQYRSVIFFQNEQQQKIALQSRLEQNQSGRYSSPIVTEITSTQPFYDAEEYHQRYLEKNGRISCHL